MLMVTVSTHEIVRTFEVCNSPLWQTSRVNVYTAVFGCAHIFPHFMKEWTITKNVSKQPVNYDKTGIVNNTDDPAQKDLLGCIT